MSANFNVNLQMSAGTTFAQEFYLANPDKTPMDITNCIFTGHISKHPGAIDAIESTSEEVCYKYIPFDTSVTNGKGGVYRLSLSPEATLHSQEGKYFYSVMMLDVNGYKTQVLSGLMFIDFGAVI